MFQLCESNSETSRNCCSTCSILLHIAGFIHGNVDQKTYGRALCRKYDCQSGSKSGTGAKFVRSCYDGWQISVFYNQKPDCDKFKDDHSDVQSIAGGCI